MAPARRKVDFIWVRKPDYLHCNVKNWKSDGDQLNNLAHMNM